MSDAVSKYLKAAEEFDGAAAEVDRHHSIVSDVAVGLRKDNRSKFCFSNLDGPGLPPEATMRRDGLSANARQWPTPVAVQTSLAKWHEARAAMVNAWSAIQEQDRKRLTPPQG